MAKDKEISMEEVEKEKEKVERRRKFQAIVKKGRDQGHEVEVKSGAGDVEENQGSDKSVPRRAK